MELKIATSTIRFTKELQDKLVALPEGTLRYMHDVPKEAVDHIMAQDNNKGFEIIYTDTHCPPSICQLVLFKAN